MHLKQKVFINKINKIAQISRIKKMHAPTQLRDKISIRFTQETKHLTLRKKTITLLESKNIKLTTEKKSNIKKIEKIVKIS